MRYLFPFFFFFFYWFLVWISRLIFNRSWIIFSRISKILCLCKIKYRKMIKIGVQLLWTKISKFFLIEERIGCKKKKNVRYTRILNSILYKGISCNENIWIRERHVHHNTHNNSPTQLPRLDKVASTRGCGYNFSNSFESYECPPILVLLHISRSSAYFSHLLAVFPSFDNPRRGILCPLPRNPAAVR